jgi:hypothetical protein
MKDNFINPFEAVAGVELQRQFGDFLSVRAKMSDLEYGRRLGPTRERIIDEAIETHYLIRPKPPMEEAYRRVVYRCRALALRPPARNSVLKRIRALDARFAARKRLGPKAHGGRLGVVTAASGGRSVRGAGEQMDFAHHAVFDAVLAVLRSDWLFAMRRGIA